MNFEMLNPDPIYAEVFLNWRQEKAAKKYNPFKQLTLLELQDHLKNCQSDLKNLKEKVDYRWFVQVGGQVVGQVALHNVNLSMRTAEIGYSIAESHQGKGFATESVRYMIDQIFSLTNLRRLIAFVHIDNIASCRVLEKLGFIREGLLREHYLINGEAVDEVVFGLLRTDWR